MAVWINADASDEEILEIVLALIDSLASRDYERVARDLGYWDLSVEAGAKAIREAIEGYRSPELFPGYDVFFVSDRRLARGGNPDPRRDVTRYKENTVGIAVSVSVDLPMNGAWSDLAADFLLFERGDHPGKYELRLEEISHPFRGDEADGTGA